MSEVLRKQNQMSGGHLTEWKAEPWYEATERG